MFNILCQILQLCYPGWHAFICIVRPRLLNGLLSRFLWLTNNKLIQIKKVLPRPILFWYYKYLIDQISCFCFVTFFWMDLLSNTIFQDLENKRHLFKMQIKVVFHWRRDSLLILKRCLKNVSGTRWNMQWIFDVSR